MKVLLVNPLATLGGAERCLIDVVASLRVHAPWVEMHALLLEDGPLRRSLGDLGVQVLVEELPTQLSALGEAGAATRSLPLARLAWEALRTTGPLAAHALRVRRALERLGPAVVHSNGAKAHALSALVRPRGAAVVWHLHDFLRPKPTSARVLRLAARRAHLAVAVSRAVAADAAVALPSLPTCVIHDAVDLERFDPTGPVAPLDGLAGAPECPPGTVRLGIVAGYGRWKGHDVLLRAWKRVVARSPRPARLYVVGGPIYRTAGSQFTRDELVALATQLGVESTVAFVPFMSDAATVFRALDVVVHASTAPEPFGLSVAEAFACGRAVVATTTCGALEVAQPGEPIALTAPPGDVDALAAALVRLIGDDDLRADLGARARALALTRLSRERLGPAVLGAYERALTASRSCARRP